MTEKVVQFPKKPISQKIDRQIFSIKQHSLFNYFLGESVFSCFIDIENYRQMEFFRILAKNNVMKVIDCRKSPVFRAPNFDHREVIKYLMERKIGYLDAISLDFDCSNDSLLETGRLISEIKNGDKGGLIFFIFCDGEGNSLDKKDIRSIFYSNEIPVIEMSDRHLK